MSIYKQLQEILDIHPAGAPASPHFDEILRMLFTKEEAALAVHMNFGPMPVEKIAAAAGVDTETAGGLLEGMARKVVIFSKKKEGTSFYGLVPTIPGLFEFPFMKGGGTPTHDKLAQLWTDYHKDSMGNSFAGAPTPQMRIIPVAKSLPPQSKAHPYEEVAHLIETSEYIALAECACRVSKKSCDAPTDVCLIFGSVGQFLAEQGYGRKISHEEGLQVLDRSEEAGLIHTSNNSGDRAAVICNCCSCCCTVLRGKTELDHPHAFATSAWIPSWESENCTTCGICVEERCPMDALSLDDDTLAISQKNCIGCGLCVSGCPEQALTLIQRENPPEVKQTLQEMAGTVLHEKGKLDKFMELMKK